jgi:ankyrin repeat protein
MRLMCLLFLIFFTVLAVYSNPLNEALCQAAGSGNLDRVKELLEAGADINNHDGGNGATPLHLAARYNRAEIIRFLLKNGAVLDAKMGYDMTPLYWAASSCNPEATEVLIHAGADLEARDSHEKNTPLIAICWGGNKECGVKIVRLLLEAGADPNARRKEDSTPLIFVARYGNIEMIKLLLDHGADPSLKRHDGMNAYQIALAGGHSEAAKLLKLALQGDYPPDGPSHQDSGDDLDQTLVKETEPNDTMKKAQNLDKHFTASGVSPVQKVEKKNNNLVWAACPYPRVSIAGSGKHTDAGKKDYFDYYSFTAHAGTEGVFDIDRGMKSSDKNSMDVVLILFNQDGTPLGGNNNCSDYSWYFGTDRGSEEDKEGLDSYFSWTFQESGLYYLGVATAGTEAEDSGFLPLQPMNENGTYILSIAVQSHGEPITDTPPDIIDDTDDPDDADDSDGWPDGFQGGLCPYIYVFDGTAYRQDTEIIPNQIGKGADTFSDSKLVNPVIADGKLTLQIREIKDEISYIDCVFVIINGKEANPLTIPAALKKADGTYLVMNKGESVSLVFSSGDTPQNTITPGSVVIRAKGYYILR